LLSNVQGSVKGLIYRLSLKFGKGCGVMSGNFGKKGRGGGQEERRVRVPEKSKGGKQALLVPTDAGKSSQLVVGFQDLGSK
jgi:hypothetical protein